jgi:hypothetical protein
MAGEEVPDILIIFHNENALRSGRH